MELRHLRYFLAVAETGHVGRAAARLNVSQPSLSQQLRDLEHHVGGQLFIRHAKGMHLTPVGQVLVGHARSTVAAAATALAEARAAADHSVGKLVIGLPETGMAFEIVRSALVTLQDRRPEFNIQTSGLAWLEQPRAVISGTIDVGFCWSPGVGGPVESAYPPGVVAIRLYEDPGSDALIPENHPLSGRKELGPEDLRDMPLGLYERSMHPSLHDAITRAAKGAGFDAIMLAEGVGSASASAPLVLARWGWTLVQKSVALKPPAGTCAVPVSGLRVDAGLDVICRTGDGRASLASFIAAVEEAFAGTRE